MDAGVIFSRVSLYKVSPAHSGSLCAFCQGAVGNVASDHLVKTLLSLVFVNANSIAPATSIKPSGGSGIK